MSAPDDPRTPHPPAPPAMPPELDAAIGGRGDAAELRAVWASLPAPQAPEANDAQRERAWQALLARRDAPGRTPFTEDPAEPLRVDRGGAAAARTSRGGAGHLSPVTLGEASRGMTPAQAPATHPRRRTPGVASAFTRRWQVAAALLLSVAGGMAWQATPETLVAPAGGTARSYRLADGSRLTLEAGSTARLARGFRGAMFLPSAQRAVTLEGTAFFAVARDGRPFVVRTSDATVQVLGTRFEVAAAEGGRGTRVAVEEGRVAVSSPVAPGQLQLAAGERARIVAGRPLARDMVPVTRLAAWRNGGLAAVDESLAAVLAELQRRFGVSVQLAATAAAGRQVTLFYPQAPALERVLADLCTMHGLVYRRTSDGFVVDAPAAGR